MEDDVLRLAGGYQDAEQVRCRQSVHRELVPDDVDGGCPPARDEDVGDPATSGIETVV
ncbi:hypothetical protein OG612_45440 (plasmid) [Streptomyces sp. NBC_01527]|uniref:hypothetical protein n=1 Tax=Streptomyces sp. NBC_01527 TaxID=2903894 RepID=UPI003866F92E